jgi:hypothetical protein
MTSNLILYYSALKEILQPTSPVVSRKQKAREAEEFLKEMKAKANAEYETALKGIHYDHKMLINMYSPHKGKNEIWFYRVDEKPYGCFSNFSPHPVLMDGKTWPTSEHYFQVFCQAHLFK